MILHLKVQLQGLRDLPGAVTFLEGRYQRSKTHPGGPSRRVKFAKGRPDTLAHEGSLQFR